MGHLKPLKFLAFDALDWDPGDVQDVRDVREAMGPWQYIRGHASTTRQMILASCAAGTLVPPTLVAHVVNADERELCLLLMLAAPTFDRDHLDHLVTCQHMGEALFADFLVCAAVRNNRPFFDAIRRHLAGPIRNTYTTLSYRKAPDWFIQACPELMRSGTEEPNEQDSGTKDLLERYQTLTLTRVEVCVLSQVITDDDAFIQFFHHVKDKYGDTVVVVFPTYTFSRSLRRAQLAWTEGIDVSASALIMGAIRTGSRAYVDALVERGVKFQINFLTNFAIRNMMFQGKDPWIAAYIPWSQME